MACTMPQAVVFTLRHREYQDPPSTPRPSYMDLFIVMYLSICAYFLRQVLTTQARLAWN